MTSLAPTLTSLPLPLHEDEHGVIRVGGTRVMLSLVIFEHQRGRSAEEIVHTYDVLKLADVYAVIAYYLTHRTEVDAYLTEQRAEDAAIAARGRATPEHQALLARIQRHRDQAVR